MAPLFVSGMILAWVINDVRLYGWTPGFMGVIQKVFTGITVLFIIAVIVTV